MLDPWKTQSVSPFVASTLGSVPIGGIVIWHGSSTTVPVRWQHCDGTNGTPDLHAEPLVYMQRMS